MCFAWFHKGLSWLQHIFLLTDETLVIWAETGCDPPSTPPPFQPTIFFSISWDFPGKMAKRMESWIYPCDTFKTMMQFHHLFNIHLNSVFGFFFPSREQVYMYLQFGFLCVKFVQLIVELLHHRVNSFR